MIIQTMMKLKILIFVYILDTGRSKSNEKSITHSYDTSNPEALGASNKIYTRRYLIEAKEEPLGYNPACPVLADSGLDDSL